MTEDRLLDGREAATILGLTYQRTMEIARVGVLRSILVGKYRKFRPVDLGALIGTIAILRV